MNSKDDGKTGYKNPPKAHRFKPGQSGNPSGRRRPLPKFNDVMRIELKKKRIISEDGQKVTVPTFHVLLKRLIDLALRGNMKALLLVMEIAKSLSTADNREWTMVTRNMTPQEASIAYAKMIEETKHWSDDE